MCVCVRVFVRACVPSSITVFAGYPGVAKLAAHANAAAANAHELQRRGLLIRLMPRWAYIVAGRGRGRAKEEEGQARGVARETGTTVIYEPSHQRESKRGKQAKPAGPTP